MTRNWFYHHTLLPARERTAPPPGPREDLLVHEGAGADYVAFIRAVRGLPGQQCEAFILHHGERFDSRLLGVTMDCSSGAAQNHLNAAVETLSAMAGGSLGSLEADLSQAYARLGPPEQTVGPAVQPYARSYARPIKLRRLLRRAVLVALLAAPGWAAWHWRECARFSGGDGIIG